MIKMSSDNFMPNEPSVSNIISLSQLFYFILYNKKSARFVVPD